MTERREREEAGLLLDQGGELLISGKYMTSRGSWGRACFLQREMTAKALSGTGAWRAGPRGLYGGYQVHLTGTSAARGSRGFLVAIDGHVHGVLTLGPWGGRSEGDSWVRLSLTLFEGGSVVITAVATMGWRGRTTGWDWLIIPTPGADWILTSVSRASMMKRTNGAHGGGWLGIAG